MPYMAMYESEHPSLKEILQEYKPGLYRRAMYDKLIEKILNYKTVVVKLIESIHSLLQ